MKPTLLLTLATLAALGATLRAQETPPPPLVPPVPPAAPAPPAPPAHGKATIILDVDGHQESHEIDLGKSTVLSLGKGHEIKIRTDGDHPAPPPREKTVWIGVTIDTVPDEVRAQLPLEPGSGIILRSVSANGPGEKAGLQKNDVLTKFDDQLLLSSQQLRLLIKAKHDGDVVRVAYLRHGQPGTADVTVGTADVTTGTVDVTKWNPDLGNFQFSLDDEGSVNGEEVSRNVNAVVKNAMKNAAHTADMSKAIVMDKAGKMVRLLNGDMVDVDTALDAMDHAMHHAGIEEKAIADTKRQVAEELKRNEHALEKAQEGLKKAGEGLKKAAAAQARAKAQADDDGDDD